MCFSKQKKSEQSEIFWNFSFLKIYFIKKVWKEGIQLMLILGLLGMYFDAVVVFVTKSSLLFRLAVAILWLVGEIANFLAFLFCDLFMLTFYRENEYTLTSNEV